MKRNNILFIIGFLAFFLKNTGVVFSANEKPCVDVQNIYLSVDETFWEYEHGKMGWGYSFYGTEDATFNDGELREISDGTKICTAAYYNDKLVAGTQKCENGSLSSFEPCWEDEPLCQGNGVCGSYESAYESNKCKTNFLDPVEFYYNKGEKGPEYYDKNSFYSGEKICFKEGEKEVVKTCSADGQWSIGKPCATDTKCVNVKTGGSGKKMDATGCYEGCFNPPGQKDDVICGEYGKNVLICNGIIWREKSLKDHFNRSDCVKCQTLADSSINCQQSLSSFAGYCYKINKDSNILQVASGIKGGYMCLDEGQILYKCDTKIETGFYDFADNCAKRDDGLNWCGNSDDDKTLRCVNKTDYDKYKQLKNERENFTTSTTSIYNPLCDGDTGISTAFGCIPFEASGFAPKLLQIIFGIAGGIAFLLMVYGFILMATSSGDEKKLQAAKETITSAVTGLLVSIFALLLFRLIVVNILKIPGL